MATMHKMRRIKPDFIIPIVVNDPLFYAISGAAGELGKDWHVFDDQVCVNENVEKCGCYFSLYPKPAGLVRVLTMPESPARSQHSRAELYDAIYTVKAKIMALALECYQSGGVKDYDGKIKSVIEIYRDMMSAIKDQ